MTDTDNIVRDVDQHDPTWCDECSNTGYVTQYIDGGRLIAQVPCGCPQTEETESDDDLPKPTDWWVVQKSWAKEIKVTYSRSVLIDIGVALIDGIQKWFKERHRYDAEWAAYSRQRCREYMLAYRQHNRGDRREWL
jgi:hypothetical protein